MRAIFDAMDGDQKNDIKDAYYKAAEGLAELIELLAACEADHPLRDQYVAASKAYDALLATKLGKVL